MSDRSYSPAIESLKLVQAALERILPAEERRIILGVHKQAVMRLEQLVRRDDARMAQLMRINDEKPSAEQIALEQAKVAKLHQTYRTNLKGRYSREGATRWICATSQIPKKRVTRYLKALPLDRGDGLSVEAAAEIE
jgi:hypothetical protein